MDIEGLNELRARIARMQNRLADKAGSGTSWNARASDGMTHRYVINGVKDFEQVSDDIHSTFVWLWSMRDRMVELAKVKGRSDRWLDAQINTDLCLCVCADIANKAKHSGRPKNPRSGKDPRLGNLTYKLPQKAIARITVRAFEVETEVLDPKLVHLEMPILDAQDRVLGDAFAFLSAGVRRWEALLSELDDNGERPDGTAFN